MRLIRSYREILVDQQKPVVSETLPIQPVVRPVADEAAFTNLLPDEPGEVDASNDVPGEISASV